MSTEVNVEMPAFKVVGRGRVLIVKAAPTLAELIRQQPFVNDDAETLRKSVLEPLKLKREDVLLAWCDSRHGGEAQLKHFIEKANFDVIISMSDDIGFAKDKRSWNFPTAQEMRIEKSKLGTELDRKIVAVKKRLDATSHRQAYSVHLVTKGATPSDKEAITVPIHKAFAPEKIVYGVVLDPYQVDTQQDWCPPKEIRATAYNFMKSSRVIGLHHVEVAPDAHLIESFLEPYPSDSDHAKAMNGEPHRVYKRRYGADTIHSGTWIIGVQLSDRLWTAVEKGELGAFSIEGFGKRIEADASEMPKVDFVEIGEIGGSGSTNS